MHYQQLLKQLYQVNLFGGVKLGLANSIALDRALNYPSNNMRFVHVAGTNGKGSVSTKIAKALELAGYRTGLFTSPHISSFRERIRINGEMIPEKAIMNLLPSLFEIAAKENLNPTFFEYTTLLALAYFDQQKVDYALMETGLGGRLDATNIISPEIAIITSISLDHTEILGNSLEEIAREKAGIIKPYTPVVIGPRVPLNIIKTIAEENKSPLIRVEGTFKTFSQENEALAKTALTYLKVEPRSIEQGLKANPPCRMETVVLDGKTIMLDVGHNPDGLKQLFKALKMNKTPILFGLSKTKDIDSCLEILKQNGSSFYPVEAANGRGLPQNELKALLMKKGIPENKVFCLPTIGESIKKALEDNDNLLICGTFFIMGQARKSLGIQEPHDFIDMNERKR